MQTTKKVDGAVTANHWVFGGHLNPDYHGSPNVESRFYPTGTRKLKRGRTRAIGKRSGDSLNGCSKCPTMTVVERRSSLATAKVRWVHYCRPTIANKVLETIALPITQKPHFGRDSSRDAPRATMMAMDCSVLMTKAVPLCIYYSNCAKINRLFWTLSISNLLLRPRRRRKVDCRFILRSFTAMIGQLSQH